MWLRWIVLVFLVSIIGVAAPAQVHEGPVSTLFESFPFTPNGDFRGRADIFIQELLSDRNRGSRALIVLYGRPSQIDSRKRLIRHHFSIRPFPLPRLEVKVGGNVSEFRTEFWIIPEGAAPPEIKPEALIAGEFGRGYKRQADKAYDTFFSELKRGQDSYVGYIINYGTPAQIALREKWLLEGSKRNFGYHPPRMTFVNGGPGPVKTVMWLVPPGAENPEP